MKPRSPSRPSRKPAKKRGKLPVMKVSRRMKKIGAEVLASATDMDAEDLVAMVYVEMAKVA